MLADSKLQRVVQYVVNEGNLDKVSCSLTRIYNELISVLTVYTKANMTEDITVSNDLTAPDIYELTLDVPDSFSAINSNSVMTAAHDYMLNMSLFEWFLITKKDEVELYQSLVFL